MKFYCLKIDEGKKKYTYAFPTFGYPTKLIQCQTCNRVWNSFENIVRYNLSFPITFVNDNFAEFISCEGCIMVSEKAKKVIEMAGICSPIFTEMPVITKNNIPEDMLKERSKRGYDINKFLNKKPVYYMISADVGANLHYDSHVVWKDYGEDICQYCGYGIGYKQQDLFAPYYIELSSWKKTDLFKVKEFGWTLFCTERFKELCIEQNLNGIKFQEVACK